MKKQKKAKSESSALPAWSPFRKVEVESRAQMLARLDAADRFERASARKTKGQKRNIIAKAKKGGSKRAKKPLRKTKQSPIEIRPTADSDGKKRLLEVLAFMGRLSKQESRRFDSGRPVRGRRAA